jgi:hypothetical protein
MKRKNLSVVASDEGNWKLPEADSPHPLFFVSVASKELSQSVSLLFATLAGGSISVAAKGVKARVRRDEGVGVEWRMWRRKITTHGNIDYLVCQILF